MPIRHAKSGNIIKSDESIINEGDVLEDIYNSASQSITSIDTVIRRIHNGGVWSLSHSGGGVGANTTKYFLLRTKTVVQHLRSYAVTIDAAPAFVRLSENPTLTDDGTLLQERNHNRNYGDADSLDVYEDPTVTDAGATLEVDLLTEDKKTGGNLIGPQEEWVLEPFTDYLVSIENQSSVVSLSTFNLIWYDQEA